MRQELHALHINDVFFGMYWRKIVAGNSPDSSILGGIFDTCSFCVDLATDASGTENLF